MNLDTCTGAPGTQFFTYNSWGICLNYLTWHCGRIPSSKQLKGRKVCCGSGYEGIVTTAGWHGGRRDWRLWRQGHDPAGLLCVCQRVEREKLVLKSADRDLLTGTFWRGQRRWVLGWASGSSCAAMAVLFLFSVALTVGMGREVAFKSTSLMWTIINTERGSSAWEDILEEATRGSSWK